MSVETNKRLAREFMERAFHQGDLSVIDEQLAPDGIDHQEPPGTDYRAHLREVVQTMRTAFPDLHFEIHEMLAEGDIVAFRSTMTGTNDGPINFGPLRGVPATHRKVSVPHMHFVRMVDGQSTDLWHIWNVPAMLQQLGLAKVPSAPPV